MLPNMQPLLEVWISIFQVSLIFGGLDESLSVKSISVKFRKYKRKQSVYYFLITVAGRHLRSHVLKIAISGW